MALKLASIRKNTSDCKHLLSLGADIRVGHDFVLRIALLNADISTIRRAIERAV